MVLSRQIDPTRPSKWYWMYKDKRPRLKIGADNFRTGLEDEKHSLCFIYIHYYSDSPPAALTVENLWRHSTANVAPVKLGSDTESNVSTENLSTNSKIQKHLYVVN